MNSMMLSLLILFGFSFQTHAANFTCNLVSLGARAEVSIQDVEVQATPMHLYTLQVYKNSGELWSSSSGYASNRKDYDHGRHWSTTYQVDDYKLRTFTSLKEIYLLAEDSREVNKCLKTD